MKLAQLAVFAGLIVFLIGAPVEAGKVTVKGVHLCCGACVATAGKALKGVPGVSKGTADSNNKIVVFEAKDAKAVEAGIKALAKAGFYGTAIHGKKPVKFPASGVKKGTKAKNVTFTGLHLCCGACVKGAQVALQKVRGVTTIDIDRKLRTIKLSGKSVDVVEAVTALNKGGFFARLKKPGKKK